MTRAVRLGRPVRRSSLSAMVIARRPALTPSQRSGSGSQRGDRCPTHGNRVSSVSRPRIRSRGSGRRGSRSRRRPRRSPRPGDPVLRSRPTPACQSRAIPAPAPGVRERVSRRPGRGRRAWRAGRRRPGVAVEPGLDARAGVVRRAAAAEREPVVRRPLSVDDQMPEVRERLARRQPGRRPERGGQRLGRHHHEYTGTTSRRLPGSPGVQASVARTTTSARTVPCVVSTRGRVRARCAARGSLR
jgi:hypothetical protein